MGLLGTGISHTRGNMITKGLKRIPVLEDLVRKPALRWDGGDDNVRGVLCPHGVGLNEAVELRKEERGPASC
jgi:hypothetical protein